MPNNTYQKDLAGVEDLAYDTNRNNESFSRRTSTGLNQNITKINARHIPVSNALTLGDAESVEDFLKEILETIGNGKFLGVFPTQDALETAYPTAEDDSVAWVIEFRSMFEWKGTQWDNSNSYLGEHADEAALIDAYPNPPYTDSYAFVTATKSFWFWDQTLGTPAWVDTLTSSDAMLKAIYDPAGIKEQLVGLTATQSMTNKTVNDVVLDATGSSSYHLDRSGNYSQVVEPSVIGNIMSPLFHMPLGNSMAIPIGTGAVSFDRSSTASYVDRYGIVQYAAIDEPRFEKQGLLIEEATTNEMWPSEDSTSPRWNDPSGEWSSVSNNVVSPDGTTNADTITLTAGDNSALLRLSLSAIPVGTYTVSFWIKDITGTTGISGQVDLDDEGVGPTTPDLNTVGTEWVRVYRTITTTAVANWVDIQLDFSGASYDVSIWGVQVEPKSFMTSYVPTSTGVATRSVETLDIDPDNIPLWSDGWGLSFDMNVIGFSTAKQWLRFGGPNNNFLQSTLNNNIVWWSDGLNTSGTLSGSFINRPLRLTCTNGTSREKMVYENGEELSLSNNNLVIDNTQLTDFRIVGTNAHYKNLRVYDKELSDNEARYV